MTGLSPCPQLGKDYVIDALLRVEKAVEVVGIGHQLSAAKYILPGTISCLALLDYKIGHSLLRRRRIRIILARDMSPKERRTYRDQTQKKTDVQE
jgi:uncharacterized DUF497 family protein